MIVVVRGRPVELCARTEGSPPQCDGRVLVRRLDLSAVPGLTTTGALSYTEDPVQLTGTLEGSILTVTEPPALDTEPPSPLPSLATPCPVPTGGWPPPPSFGASGLIDDYVAGQAETFGGLRADHRTGVVTVTFTGDLARHRAALDPARVGPVCVAPASTSVADLDATEERLRADTAALRRQGLTTLYTEGDNRTGRVDVYAVYADEDDERWLRRRYGSNVDLRSMLSPVGG